MLLRCTNAILKFPVKFSFNLKLFLGFSEITLNLLRCDSLLSIDFLLTQWHRFFIDIVMDGVAPCPYIFY